MMDDLKSMGLGAFCENEGSFQGLLWEVAAEGKIMRGYYGIPYMQRDYGWPEMIATYDRDEIGRLRNISFDPHCSGLCTWKLRVITEMPRCNPENKLERNLMMETPEEPHSMIAMHLVRGDILPSFARGETYDIQVIGFPESTVRYYSNYEFYKADEDVWAESKDGKRFTMAQDALIPFGVFNHENDPSIMTSALLCGTVQRLYWGEVKLDTKDGPVKMELFVDCIVKTQFGDFEIVHTMDQIPESDLANLKKGSVVFCSVHINGDPAVCMRKNGILMDRTNHLRLIAYSLGDGDPARLRSVVSDHFTYVSEAAPKTCEDIESYLEFVQKVKDHGKKCCPRYAMIVAYKGDKPASYGRGTHCLALTYGEEQKLQSVLFVDMDGENRISRIYVSNDTGYQLCYLDSTDFSEFNRGEECSAPVSDGLYRELFELLYTKDFSFAKLKDALETGKYNREAVSYAAYKYVDECMMEAWGEECGGDYPSPRKKGELLPGFPSSHMHEALTLMLQYGLDPNLVFVENDDYGNIMQELHYVDNGYIAADCLALLLEHGGNPSIMIHNLCLIRVINTDLQFDLGEQGDRVRYDSLVHYWMVLVGYGAKLENGMEPVDMCKGHNASELKEHRNFYYGAIHSDKTEDRMEICFFDKETNREVGRY